MSAEGKPAEGKRAGAPTWWRVSVHVLTAATVLCAVLVVAGLLDYISFLPALFAQYYGLALCGIAWVVLLAFGLFRYRTWLPLLTPALVVVLLAVLIVFAVPQRVQLATSQSALDAAADRCPVSEDATWIGTYRFIRVLDEHGECFFYERSFIDQYGLVRLPAGPPADARMEWNMTLTHLDGDWYRFRWHF